MHNCSYILSNYISLNAFIVLSLFLVGAFVLIVFFNFDSLVEYIAGGSVVLGSILNLLQWGRVGCVLDPFNFFNLFHFNFADVLITSGIFILAYKLLSRDE